MSNIFQHYGERDAPIAQGAAGQSQVVACPDGFKIRLVGYAFTLDAAGTAKFQSGNNDKTGPMTIAANGGVAVGHVPFMCNAGEDLNISTTVGLANGHVVYQLIPA